MFVALTTKAFCALIKEITMMIMIKNDNNRSNYYYNSDNNNINQSNNMVKVLFKHLKTG